MKHRAGEPNHLAFLDGIRGLASLYIVIHHAGLEIYGTPEFGGLGPWAVSIMPAFTYDRWAVGMFIILSGYCLTHSAMNESVTPTLRGGAKEFFIRRAKRILPAYYTTMLVTLAMIALVPHMGELTGLRWDLSLPALNWPTILSHLVLVHNFSPDWSSKINYPYWSIATEWQIYLFFPAFLFLIRKAGWAIAVGLWCALGLILSPALSRLGIPLDQASPWYLGFFALGGLCARLTHGQLSNRARNVLQALGVIGALAGGAACALLGAAAERESAPSNLLHEALLGLTAFLVLLALALAPLGRRNTVLNTRALQALGKISYSLYLIHAPILAALHIGLIRAGVNSDIRLVSLLTGGVLGSVLVASLLYTAVERPFLSRRKQSETSILAHPVI